jgi:hypothetical protein
MSEKIMDRVRALLAIAEHPNTGAHEADTALTQANRLIQKHALDEAILRASQSTAERRAVVDRSILLAAGDSEFLPVLRTIAWGIAEYNRCKAVILETVYGVPKEVRVFGMDEDVRWVEMLYTTVHFQFLSRINPKWDPSLGFDQNVYNFKVAGFKWATIDDVAVRNGEPTAKKDDGSISSKLISAYRRHMKKIGDTNPISTQNGAAFREQFGRAFMLRFLDRIAAWAAESDSDRDSTPGAAVALVSLAEEVNDAFFAAYPELRPEVRAAANALRREEIAAARAALLESMTPSERAKFLEREQREQRFRKPGKRSKPDSAAERAGAAAADGISLDRVAGRADGSKGRGAIG